MGKYKSNLYIKNYNQTNTLLCIVIDVDGSVATVTDPKDITNAFNVHYTSVAEKILKDANKRAIDAIMPNSKTLILSHL